jgi:hypothetical protein
MKYTQLFEEFINEAMIQVSNKSIKSNKSKIDTSLIDKLVKQIAPVLNSEHNGTLTKKGYEDVIMAIAKNISGSGALQDPGVIFENKLNEAKYSFTLTYNDAKYVQKVLDDAGVDALAKAGVDDEEVIVRAFDGMGLRRAKQALEADHFDINESVVNEGDMTKFYDGFIVLDSKTKKTYKFKYVKGTKNTEVEFNAISKLASSTKQPSSNFMVHGFIQKGEWDNSKEKTIDESVVNEGINAKDIKVGTILNFKDGETWKVTKTSGISSGKIFAAPYGDTKKSYVSIPLEFSIESLEKDVTSIE